MSKRIKLRIPGTPIPQPRPRAVRTFGGHPKMVSAFKQHPVYAFKEQVKIIASLNYHHGEPLLGPVKVEVTFVMPRPSSMRWVRKPMNRTWCGVLPDFDNLVKSLLDPLKGLVWKDDGQIAVAHIVKVIAAGNELPHTIIEISQLEEW
jgi:Holliday junction resolvase RusA-like endonuclease